MRVFPAGEIARPAYYDRRSLVIPTGINAIYAPHAFTTRASYTAPYKRAMFIEVINIFVFRQTVAAGVVYAQGIVRFQPYTLSFGRVAQVPLAANTVYATEIQTLTDFGYMDWGDVIEIATEDLCTGGSVQYIIGVKGTEFDSFGYE